MGNAANLLNKPLLDKTVELIGINDPAIATNQFSASKEIIIGDTLGSDFEPFSGETLNIGLYFREDQTGAIIQEDGTLFLFDADPSISIQDTDIPAGSVTSVIATIPIAAVDWVRTASTGLPNGAVVKKQIAESFGAKTRLYAAYRHEGATSINSAGTDDEHLDLRLWARRDS